VKWLKVKTLSSSPSITKQTENIEAKTKTEAVSTNLKKINSVNDEKVKVIKLLQTYRRNQNTP
jgi:hypothetical protein